MSIALLVVDVQKQFYQDNKLKTTIEPTIEYINETTELFREAGHPVVFIQDVSAGDGPGSAGYEVIDELVQKESDYYVSKVQNNSFYETDLDEYLKSKGIKFVVVSGFAAEYCVLFTLNGAEERGYGASLLQHGVAGIDLKQVKQTHLIRATISLEAIYYMLKGKDE